MRARKSDIEWYNKNYYSKESGKRHQWYDMLMYDLRASVRPADKVLEVGCGQSVALRGLVREKLVPEKNIYGIDQSKKATAELKRMLPQAHIEPGDIYRLPFREAHFDIVLMMEVIEHLQGPSVALKEIKRVLKPGGLVYISFPNFSVFPWNIVRFISDRAKLSGIINKQPIDNIYTIDEVKRIVEKEKFKCLTITGVTYLTALFTPLESLGEYAFTKMLNSFRLSGRSLHPLMKFYNLQD